MLEAGILGLVVGRKVGREDLCDLFGTKTTRKDKAQQVSSYRAGDDTGDWISKEEEGCGSVFSLYVDMSG